MLSGIYRGEAMAGHTVAATSDSVGPLDGAFMNTLPGVVPENVSLPRQRPDLGRAQGTRVDPALIQQACKEVG